MRPRRSRSVVSWIPTSAGMLPGHRADANGLRNFDLAANQFVVSAAELDFQRTASPIGFHVELNVGSASDIIHPGGSESLKLVQQAYLTAVLPVGAGLTLDAGKFVTHMGFETIKAKDNYNYSRSFPVCMGDPVLSPGDTRQLSAPREPHHSPASAATAGTMCGKRRKDLRRQRQRCSDVGALPSGQLDRRTRPAGVSQSSSGHVLEGIVTVQATEKLAVGVDGTYGTESLPTGPVRGKGSRST